MSSMDFMLRREKKNTAKTEIIESRLAGSIRCDVVEECEKCFMTACQQGATRDTGTNACVG